MDAEKLLAGRACRTTSQRCYHLPCPSSSTKRSTSRRSHHRTQGVRGPATVWPKVGDKTSYQSNTMGSHVYGAVAHEEAAAHAVDMFFFSRDTAETHHTLEERKKSDTTRINHTTLRGDGHVPPRGTVAPGRRHPDHLATPTRKPQKLVQPHKK